MDLGLETGVRSNSKWQAVLDAGGRGGSSGPAASQIFEHDINGQQPGPDLRHPPLKANVPEWAPIQRHCHPQRGMPSGRGMHPAPVRE